MQMELPKFSVIGAPVIRNIVEKDCSVICQLVKDAYRDYGRRRATNPHSSFLRLNSSVGEANRIIALPAALYGEHPVGGVKWVSSFPSNLSKNLPRASAVLILNNLENGFPLCCLEGSIVSAARTAASAAIGADVICDGQRAMRSIGIVGNGLIAKWVFSFLIKLGWRFDEVQLYDISMHRSRAFANSVIEIFDRKVTVAERLDQVLQTSDLILLATTAVKPYIENRGLLAHHPRILNISLRDLVPGLIFESENLVDDTEHCLREGTSLHLAEQEFGSREFINANIYDCLDVDVETNWRPSFGRTAIFSPFGMGVLDLAVGSYIYRVASRDGHLRLVDAFFPFEDA